MTPAQTLEGRALESIAQVLAGNRIEDSLVEAKSIWPDPYATRTAWQLGGLANAALGEPVIWLVGLNEDGHSITPMLEDTEPSEWWAKVRARFNGVSPGSAVVDDYPRAADLPKAGFAGGPCLLKDTMQLAAYNNNNFLFGQASMNINEGLPLYVVSKLAERYDLGNMTVGILGMAFKADTDDTRWSLSYKLRRILQFRSRKMLCTDPFVDDDQLVDLGTVLERSDLLIVGTPHNVYRGLEPTQPVADVWGILGRGVRV